MATTAASPLEEAIGQEALETSRGPIGVVVIVFAASSGLQFCAWRSGTQELMEGRQIPNHTLPLGHQGRARHIFESSTSIGASKSPSPNIVAMCGKWNESITVLRVGRLLRTDVDRATVIEEQEMVCRSSLVEAHHHAPSLVAGLVMVLRAASETGIDASPTRGFRQRARADVVHSNAGSASRSSGSGTVSATARPPTVQRSRSGAFTSPRNVSANCQNPAASE
jgi:hypothetical protein